MIKTNGKDKNFVFNAFAKVHIDVRFRSFSSVSKSDFVWLSESAELIGDSECYGLDTEFDNQIICSIQIATASRCLLLYLGRTHRSKLKKERKAQISLNASKDRTNHPLAQFLMDPYARKFGAELWYDALLIYKDTGFKMTNGCDLTRAWIAGTNDPKSGLFQMFSDVYPNVKIVKDSVSRLQEWDTEGCYQNDQLVYACLDGVVSCLAGVAGWNQKNTNGTTWRHFSLENATELQLAVCVYSIYTQKEIAHLDEAVEKACDFQNAKVAKEANKLIVNMTRFKSRIRQFDSVVATTAKGAAYIGYASKVLGRQATITMTKKLPRSIIIKSLKYTEKSSQSLAELGLETLIQNILTDGLSIYPTKAIELLLWSSIGEFSWAALDIPVALKADAIDSNVQFKSKLKLNKACNLDEYQQKAVDMLTAQNDVLLAYIHGPPGTGKTRVISTAIPIIKHNQDPKNIIIIATQSNIAVKNVAEVLVRTGFEDFLLIVSQDFHFQWHEEQYLCIGDKVIVSNQISKTKVKRFAANSVFLMTMSMASNLKTLEKILNNRPVTHMIFDEASQIEMSVLVWPLSLFGASLKKIAFLGDDNQLPPFGSQDMALMNPFYMLPELRQHNLCLETHLKNQYRMHHAMASFLDKNIYHGNLMTPIERMMQQTSVRTSPVVWVNIQSGQGHTTRGNSLVNLHEADAICGIIKQRKLKTLDYAVISGYDAQRGAISNALESVGGSERVYTIDSYQGHEAKIVFVSITRTRSGLGFMAGKIGQKRVNVMLSRAQSELIAVGDHNFVQSMNSKSNKFLLLARFAGYCADADQVYTMSKYLNRFKD